MTNTETMTKAEAIAELIAVGAKFRVWSPGRGLRETIYVGRQEIWCSSAGHVSAERVWQVVYGVVIGVVR
jgi:hypothetical protein